MADVKQFQHNSLGKKIEIQTKEDKKLLLQSVSTLLSIPDYGGNRFLQGHFFRVQSGRVRDWDIEAYDRLCHKQDRAYTVPGQHLSHRLLF